jgi:hypothetical protein
VTQRVVGDFTVGTTTVAFGTAFASLIAPWRGSGGAPLQYKVGPNGRPNWVPGAYTHVTQAVYTAAGTAHDLVFMRPLNWAVVAADVAANSGAVTLLTDPGLYSTNYKYPLGPDAGGVVATVANNAIAGSDYVAVQLRDGTWHMSLVTSVSSLTVTMTTVCPNVTGGGIEAGSILFFFGVAADVNPQTGKAHLAITSVASARTSLLDSGGGGVPTLNPGDPMILYSANAAATGILNSASGRYKLAA